jgi:UDP-2,4-diacetamido-2,4,6-trideoxy-beta-L-altropyranose hydrolase
VGVNNMARLMVDSDLAIGAAGSTSWERCCLGLPTIQLILAGNQKEAAAALTELGAVVSVSSVLDLSVKLPELMQQFQSNGELSASLFECSSKVCDGRGTAIITDWILNILSLTEVDK